MHLWEKLQGVHQTGSIPLSPHIHDRFLWIVNNNAAFAREHYARQASGVSASMKNVSRDVILNLPVPLPPLAEQHCIVAKGG